MTNCICFFISLLLSTLLVSGCVAPVNSKRPPLFKHSYELEQARGSVRAETSEKNEEAALAENLPVEKAQIIQAPDFLHTAQVSFGTTEEGGSDAGKLELPAGENVQISVEGMPIYDFVNLVFGQVLKLSYAVSPEVQKMKEKVTLNMTEPMDAVAFFFFANELLSQYRIEAKEARGNLYIDRSAKNSRPTFSAELYFGREVPPLSPAKKITQIVPTDYVSAKDLVFSLGLFIQGITGVSYNILKQPQGLIISGSVAQVQQVVEMIALLDRPFVAGKSVQLLPLEFVSVGVFYNNLRDILYGLGIPVATQKGQIGLTLIPLEQLGSLLVISPKQEWVDVVTYWQRQLDSISAMGESTRLFVFKPQYRLAEELVEVIEGLIKSRTDTVSVKNQQGLSRPLSNATALQPTQNKISSASNTASTNQREGFELQSLTNVKVSLDENRNAVILMATPAVFQDLKEILDRLDTPPRQVITEVTIAEVTLSDQLELGLEWFLNNNGTEYNSTVKTLSGLGLGGSGFNAIFSKLNGDFQVMLNAFAKDDLINIISTPHIVVLDGNEATINVGTEVPVVTSETSASDIGSGSSEPTILRNIQYRNTGVVLKVKPVIHSDGMLTIDISQELSEAQTNNISDISSPLILNRSITTALTLKSGESVVLGGLISENKSQTENKVPFLGDLPFLGHLFKTNSDAVQKTELIVQITPYIVNSPEELDRISRDFKIGQSMLDNFD